MKIPSPSFDRDRLAREFVAGIAVFVVLLLAAPAHAQVFDVSPCPFLVLEPEVEGETVVCGDLTVPENRSDPSVGTISLKVAILEGRGLPEADPVVFLEGGPGGSAVLGVPEYLLGSGLRRQGDLIVFDQRGTGYSTPSLDCTALVDEDADDALAECRRLLVERGVDLASYDSRENAADVADLLEALGIEEASLYGVSYGTRLALTVVRDHPERIRSLILDGVYPPHVQGLEEQPLFGNRAFEVLFADCRADLACDDQFPELRETFLEMVEYLNEEPMLDQDGWEVDGDDVLNQVYELLYDTAAIPYLPALIYAAWEGDHPAYEAVLEDLPESAPTGMEQNSMQGLEEALDRRLVDLLGVSDLDELYDELDAMDDDEYEYWLSFALGAVDEDSEGMFNSVECREEVPFNDPDVAAERSEELPLVVAEALLADVYGQIDDCSIWSVEPASPLENEPVASAVPTLVLSGEYDPITPPAWGDAAADHLSNSRHYVFPAMGHGTVDAHPCPTSIAVSFLASPMSELDSGCLDAMSPPVFHMPLEGR